MRMESGRARHALIALASLGIMIGILGAAAWKNFVKGFLETGKPVIRFVEAPRGVGELPARLLLQVVDEGMGIDEVQVEIEQRGNGKTLLRKSFAGEASQTIELNFSGKESGLHEGQAVIFVKAFDKSFWSNSAERRIALRIDYRKPNIQTITQQHNVRVGGSQLVVYRVQDDNLGASGVRIDNTRFLGVRAELVDPSIKDPQVFAAFYSVPLGNDPKTTEARLFAEDLVGNAISIRLPQRVLPRSPRQGRLEYSDESFPQIEKLFNFNLSRLRSILERSSGPDQLDEATVGALTKSEKLRLLIDALAPLDELEVSEKLRSMSFQKLYSDALFPQRSSLSGGYGEKVEFFVEKTPAAEFTRKHFAYRFWQSNELARASADGIVLFRERIGTFGEALAIDHGLGLVSLYGNLKESKLIPGQRVKAGDEVGPVGDTGLLRPGELLFSIYLQGVPVDPQEWFDRGWTYGHIDEKLKTVHGLLGIEG